MESNISTYRREVLGRCLRAKLVRRLDPFNLLSDASEPCGIAELLAESGDKFWQSDGPLPHTVTVEFPVKTAVSYLFLYFNFTVDESYTPHKWVCYLNAVLGT